MKEIFSDGLSDIYVSRGLAFLDFYHLVPDEKGHHERVTFLRITVPLTKQGFFGLFNTGDAVLNHLIEVGMLHAEPVAPASAKQKADSSVGKKMKGNAVKLVPAKKTASAKKAEAKPAAKPAPAPAKKVEAKPVPAPVKKTEAKPAAKPAPAPAKKAEAKPAAKPVPAPAKKAEAKPAAKPAPAPAKKAEAKPAAKPAPAPAKKPAPAPAKKPVAKAKKK